MEKKLNKEIENKVDTVFDVILVFVSMMAFIIGLINGEIIWSAIGFIILTYLEVRKIGRKVSKIEKKICGEVDND